MGLTWRELERRGRDIRNLDPGTGCLLFIFFITGLLVLVAGFIYAANFKLVALCIMLVPCVVWLFLIFYGGAFNPQLDFRHDRRTCRCCFCLACLVFGVIILDIFQIIILSLPKTENKAIHLDASNATLTRFNFPFSNSSILTYHFSLKVNVGPNKEKTGVYYHKIQARAFYQGQNFTNLSIPPFYLGGNKNHTYNSTVVLHPVFQGQQAVVLTGDGLKRYQKETAARRYSIDVTLSYLGIRTNDYNDHNMTAADSNDKLNKAGDQLLGVVTFGLKVPLSSDVTGIASPHNGPTTSFEH